MTTGLPAASLPATCGSDPIDRATPFGDRQGTRLKMSPADLATSFTLSIALPVMPFGAAGLTAATGPACGGAASAEGFVSVLLSVLALSDSAACCGAVWARSGDNGAGISSARLAARTAGNIDEQKGRRRLINPGP